MLYNDIGGIIMKNDEFSKLKDPISLLQYMNSHIEHGFYGANNKVYTNDDPSFKTDFNEQYVLQTPEQTLATGRGKSFDQVELERTWFTNHNYEFKTYFMNFELPTQTDKDLPMHSFLAYFENNNWYWFENSFGSHKDIHRYDDIEQLIEDVQMKHFLYGVKNKGLSRGDLAYLKIKEFDTPTYGENLDEYIKEVTSSKFKTR